MYLKKLLTKSFLVAAGLLVGTSAWATVTNGTLDHTASVQWGKDTGASTCDAETEYFNFDSGSSTWSAAAFAQFSFTLPDGETITSAQLKWKGTSGKAYGSSLYYLNVGQTFSFAPLPEVGTNMQYSGNKTLIDGGVVSLSGGVSVTTDVTNAVKAVAAGKQSYIIFQWTGNNGGASLYGKGSTNAPTLEITTTAESTYAITFSETNGVAATIKIGGSDVTSGTSLVNGTYDFTATAAGYQDYAGSFTVASADQEVSFTMTAKSTYNYTVKAVDGSSNNLGTVNSGSGYADESVTYYYPEFILAGTTLHKVKQEKYISKNYWCNSGTLDTNNKEFTVTYGDGTISDVVYYKEAEDIEGFTAKTTNNATIRCSNGIGGVSTDEVALTTLPAGKYTIFGQVWGTTGMTATIKAGETKVWELETTGSLAQKTSAEFELLTSTNLTVVTTGGNDNRMLDLVYIVKTGDATTSVTTTLDNAGYATFASEYPLDLTTANMPAGVTAYKAAVDGKTAKFTAIDQTVPANTGILLKGAANAEVTINVVASGTTVEGNAFLVNEAGTTFSAETGYYYFAMKKNEADLTFATFAPGTLAIPASKAYLKVAESNFTGGARLFVTFDEDETTGINEELRMKNEESSTAPVYNLNGQRVAQPTRGLYIVNGKKIVVK